MHRNQTIKIKFKDGSFKIEKNVHEFVSGIYCFFFVQVKNGIEVPRVFKREEIDCVEKKDEKLNRFRKVKLKKRF